MIALTLTRAELTLADLVIDSDPFSGAFHIPEEGVDWPRWTRRRIVAPTSGIVDGVTVLSDATDLGAMPATIYVKGASMAALATARAELEAAVGQFSYTLKLEVSGVEIGAWAALSDTVDWGEIDTGMVRAFTSRATVTFPLQPGAI